VPLRLEVSKDNENFTFLREWKEISDKWTANGLRAEGRYVSSPEQTAQLLPFGGSGGLLEHERFAGPSEIAQLRAPKARRGRILDVFDRGATKGRDANPRFHDGRQTVRCSRATQGVARGITARAFRLCAVQLAESEEGDLLLWLGSIVA